MLLVAVVCSDPDCAQECEIAIEDLDAVDATVCDCGYGFVVVTVSGLDEAGRSGSLITLPEPRPAPSRRAA